MTNLADVYEGHVGEVHSPRRLHAGAAVVSIGAALVVVGMVVGTTSVLELVGFGQFEIRATAAILAGLGTTGCLLGVCTILPASNRIRAATVIGLSVSLLGVALFWYAYPSHWDGHGQNLTFLVTAVYFLGTVTMVGCLFAGIATFKQRNDPGGTVNLVIEGEESEGGDDGSESGDADPEPEPAAPDSDPDTFGGVGVLGAPPSGEVATQTGTDGGAVERDVTSPLDDAQVLGRGERAPAEPDLADRYCGNCAHFSYVRTESGMTPYCGRHDELMDDMEACDGWQPNR